jgi:hypothetical protein
MAKVAKKAVAAAQSAAAIRENGVIGNEKHGVMAALFWRMKIYSSRRRKRTNENMKARRINQWRKRRHGENNQRQ